MKNKGFISLAVIAVILLVVAIGGSFGLYYFKNINSKNNYNNIKSLNKAYYLREYESLKLIDFNLYLPSYVPDGYVFDHTTTFGDIDFSYDAPYKPNFLTFVFIKKSKEVFSFNITQSKLFDYNPPTSCGNYSPPKTLNELTECLPDEVKCDYCKLETTTKKGYQIYHHHRPQFSENRYLVKINSTLFTYEQGKNLSLEDFVKIIDSMEKISKDAVLEKEKSNHPEFFI